MQASTAVRDELLLLPALAVMAATRERQHRRGQQHQRTTRAEPIFAGG